MVVASFREQGRLSCLLGFLRWVCGCFPLVFSVSPHGGPVVYSGYHSYALSFMSSSLGGFVVACRRLAGSVQSGGLVFYFEYHNEILTFILSALW